VQRDKTGLRGKKASKSYAKKVAAAESGWNNLTPLKRIAALLGPANDQLSKAKVPTVMGIIDPLGTMQGTATHASFNRALWQVWFNPAYLGPGITPAQFGRIANTVYHECRHAEQTFRVARKLAAEGRNPTEIAQMISISTEKAKEAADYPLPTKNKKEWEEAEAWQFNMVVVEGTDSRADLVNAQQDAAMQAYGRARAVWRGWKQLYDNDPAVDPILKNLYDGELLKSGGAGRMKKASEISLDDYISKRERAKQAYRQYAMMPVEEDAWATGALIQKHLGLNPSTVEEELANLDSDERTMIPVVLLSLRSGSQKEQELLRVFEQML